MDPLRQGFVNARHLLVMVVVVSDDLIEGLSRNIRVVTLHQFLDGVKTATERVIGKVLKANYLFDSLAVQICIGLGLGRHFLTPHCQIPFRMAERRTPARTNWTSMTSCVAMTERL